MTVSLKHFIGIFSRDIARMTDSFSSPKFVLITSLLLIFSFVWLACHRLGIFHTRTDTRYTIQNSVSSIPSLLSTADIGDGSINEDLFRNVSSDFVVKKNKVTEIVAVQSLDIVSEPESDIESTFSQGQESLIMKAIISNCDYYPYQT